MPRPAGFQRVRRPEQRRIVTHMRHALHDMAHRIQPRALAAIALAHAPRRVGFVAVQEHRLIRARVAVQLVQ
jgi:hypothetical protein